MSVLPKVPPLLDVQAAVRSDEGVLGIRDVAVRVTDCPPTRNVLSAETETVGGRLSKIKAQWPSDSSGESPYQAVVPRRIAGVCYVHPPQLIAVVIDDNGIAVRRRGPRPVG